jgi:hypothetical protein
MPIHYAKIVEKNMIIHTAQAGSVRKLVELSILPSMLKITLFHIKDHSQKEIGNATNVD